MSKIEVLVYEQDTSSAAAISLALRALGYGVTGFSSDPQSALKLASKLKADLALIDIDGAGEALGLSLALSLRRRFELPIVYTTSFVHPAVAAQLTGSPAVDFVLRPLSSERIAAAIERCFNRHLSSEGWIETQPYMNAEELSKVNALNNSRIFHVG